MAKHAKTDTPETPKVPMHRTEKRPIRKGVHSEFGKRNALFIAARKAAFDGKVDEVEALKSKMAAIQPVSKRELAAIERQLPLNRNPEPRHRA